MQRLKVTREGKYFIVITLGVGLAAINTGNNLLYLLFGWLLSMIIASGVLSNIALRNIVYRRRLPAQIFAGTPFSVETCLRNGKGVLTSYALESADTLEKKPLNKRCQHIKIAPGQESECLYRHAFSKRGRVTLDGVWIYTRFPFGLFEKRVFKKSPSECVVFPKTHTPSLPALRGRAMGHTALPRKGRSGDFFGLREYRVGDDLNSIHWKSSARTTKLLVREREDEARKQVTLVLDNARTPQERSGESPELEAAIEEAASLAKAYIANAYAVALVCRGTSIPFSTGSGHLTRILHTLALLEAEGPRVPFAGTIHPHAFSILCAPKSADVSSQPRVDHRLELG